MQLEDRRLVKGAAACSALLWGLAACAGNPVPDTKIAVAKASLQRADQSSAPEYAPVELAAARDKLQRAQKAAADHDARPATELAEQADVDAQLAEAIAQEQRSQKAVAELDASLKALQQEASQSAPRPPSPPRNEATPMNNHLDFVSAAAAALALGACASTPPPNAAIESARAAIDSAQADPNVAQYAPLTGASKW